MNHQLKNFLILSFLSVIFVLPQNVEAKINTTEILDSVNQQRTANNLPPLNNNEELNKAAELKAEEIFKYQMLSHDLPLMTFFWPVSQNHYIFETVGENLAIDFEDSQNLIQKWMGSATHRQNIIDSNFEDTGIAIKEGFMNGVPTKVVVEYFGRQKKQSNYENETPVREAATAGASVLTALILSFAGLRKYF